MNFSYVTKLDVVDLRLTLNSKHGLWDAGRRNREGSPHAKVQDIWVRANDRRPFDTSEKPWSEFDQPHEPVWYPASTFLPCRRIILDAARSISATQIGGVLITKLAPGDAIQSHVDRGWHAEYYADKLYVALQAAPGMKFGFPDGTIEAKDGEVYRFNNQVPHWIMNDSEIDRLAMIVCVRRGKEWT